MSRHEVSQLSEREDVVALGQRITAITDALDSIISLGAGLGIKDTIQSSSISLLNPDERSRTNIRYSSRFSKSPWVVLGDGENGSPRIGMTERLVASQNGTVTATGYRTIVQPVSEEAVKRIQASPQPYSSRELSKGATIAEVPSVEDLWTPSSYFNPFNIIRFIRRENLIDRLKSALPLSEQITSYLVTSSQNPELNPLFAVSSGNFPQRVNKN